MVPSELDPPPDLPPASSPGGPDDPGGSGDFVARLNALFAAIAGWSFDHRWIVLAGCVGLAAGAVTLAGQARIDNSYEAYFAPTDPSYQAYEKYRDDFGSDEVSYVLYEAPDAEHGPWNLEIMRKISAITEALQDEVPFVYDVKTLANAELIEGVPDGIEIREIGDEFPETQEELLEWRERVLANPLLVGGIASADGRYGAIIIEMDRSSTDPPEAIRLDPAKGDALDNLYPQVTENAIEAIFDRPEYADIRFYHSGDVPLNAVYNNVIAEESGKLDAIASAVIGLWLLFFFRSFVAALAPLIVVQMSVILCVALVVLLGWKLDMSFGSMPTLLTAIGVAHSVHILSEFRLLFRELRDRRAALVKTLYLVGTPCLLTSVTTAAGFASMSFVPIKSIAHSGVYGAFGVMAAFFMSLTLLMALLSFGRRTPRAVADASTAASSKGGERVRASLRALADFNIRFRVPIVIGCVGVFVFSFVGITRLIVDSNWLDDFSERMPIKSITKRVDEVMGGTTNVIYLFDAGEDDAIKNPEVLREIERVQQIADSHDHIVRKTYSLVDILKDLNKAFHGGDPAYYRLPETRELVAQYLLLYEMSGGEEAEEYVSPDYRRASLELRIKLAMTSETAELVEQIDAAIAAQPLEKTKMEMTGIGALWIKLLDYIVTSQVQGFLMAFGVIAIIMVLMFRSFQTGMISMVPNVAPIFLTLGVMGWAGIPLDYNKIMIAAVAMGIAVDDTIHLLMRYRHEFLVHRDYEVALREAMQDVGRALLITSIALISGFLVFTLSVMDSQATFGILLASTIATALVADFLLLPALILSFHPFGPEGARQRLDAALEEAA